MELNNLYLPSSPGVESHFACPDCNTPADMKMADELLCNNITQCKNCCNCDPKEVCFCIDVGFYDIISAHVILREQAQQLVDNPEDILKTDWYHITTIAPENMVFNGEKCMHIGQEDTVKALQEMKYQDQEVYCYRLRFEDNVILHDELLHDKSAWTTYETQLQEQDVTAFAYINRWEATGSLSLFVLSEVVHVVEVTRPPVIPKRETYTDYKYVY